MPAEKHGRSSSSGENTPVMPMKKRRISRSPLLATPALVLEQLQNVRSRRIIQINSNISITHLVIIMRWQSGGNIACAGVDWSNGVVHISVCCLFFLSVCSGHLRPDHGRMCDDSKGIACVGCASDLSAKRKAWWVCWAFIRVNNLAATATIFQFPEAQKTMTDQDSTWHQASTIDRHCWRLFRNKKYFDSDCWVLLSSCLEPCQLPVFLCPTFLFTSCLYYGGLD